MSRPDRIGWDRYVDQFHASRPGITETVLRACRARGSTPYQWLATAIDGSNGVLLDLACGSGPLVPLVRGAHWIGVDRSDAELRVAQHRHPHAALVRAAADRLPLCDHRVDAVACSLAFMTLAPLEPVVDELARVTRASGKLVVLLPTSRPLVRRDRSRYLRLSLALRARPAQFPNPVAVRDTARLLTVGGFTVTSDERLRFAYPITDEVSADALVDSFYLPGVTPERLGAARRVARSWPGTSIGIPLRRIVAISDDDPRS